MSVSAADAGNSSNSNFHKIQILKTLLITIQIIIKATIILIKNDNINLKNQYTKQEKNENNTYTKNNNLEDKDVYNTLNNVENYDINSNLNNSETITNMVSNSSNKDNISIDLPNYSAYAGKVITINATIKTKNGTPLNLAKAAFKVNGNTKAHLNVTNGKLIYAFKIPQWSAKKYNLTLVVGETNTTNSLSKNSTLTLYKLNTTINTPYLTFSQKDKVSYVNATIKDQLNRTVYTGNTSIKINGVEKTGKGGIKATDLFDTDGNINFNAAIKGKDGSSTPVFADKSASYTIELTSTGYPSVSGTVQLNTSTLEASIKKAEALDSSKYTAETWKVLQTALTEAKEAKSANTQAMVDAANTKLTEALAGLKEKAFTPSNPTTEKKNNTAPSTTEKKNNTTPALKKANVKLSKPVLKVGKTTKNKAKVTWKKVKKATGYEIQYTTKGFGNKKATKTIKVSKAKITSAQLKKLTKKTKYKVRIRAVYTKAGYQTATSKWSAIKTVKTK
ncbi:fibronectin type III domain-containing protein [Methanosphaera sp.]|uniref:fibronectin type III domain-containing protein n=1 Tax=Methanosphaera sp. TaxID=2666342 RepID=UPI0026DFE491|nr:fibronectin type III domain-containing protein [Methanosphaera sp.]MDO5822829.1 fibronectin type III domain-containing protein [Methanosphaera sp.]